MRILKICFSVFFAAIFCSAAAHAQYVEQHLWLYGDAIKVVNTTTRPAMIQVGIQELPVPKGERGVWRLGAGFFLSYGYSSQLTVGAKVCDGLTVIRFGPPEWAGDVSRFGEDAITQGYMASDPSAPELREKVEDLRGTLRSLQPLGWREMGRELRFWFKEISRHGVVERVACSGDYKVARGYPVHVYHNNQQRRIQTFFLRERGGEYFISPY
ncbi:MAG: hypothetical protein HY435_00865 [Candidatus Liptonbacteria bacterium]|nr:hypothetical protein [Candidatus Liptonbacteria bacterium]